MTHGGIYISRICDPLNFCDGLIENLKGQLIEGEEIADFQLKRYEYELKYSEKKVLVM